MRRLFSTLVLMLMTAVLTGVGVYRFMLDTQDVSCSEQCSDVTLQLEDLSEQLTIAEAEIEKLLAAQDSDDEAFEPCTETLNADEATQTVRYQNEDRNISFDIPYNPSWGYGDASIDPYEELQEVDALLFGFPEEVSPCTWAYTHQLSFLSARYFDDIAADVLERNAELMGNSDIEQPDTTPQKIELGHLEAYTYTLPGYCEAMNIEVVTTKQNYIFTSCFTKLEDLQKIVESAEFF